MMNYFCKHCSNAGCEYCNGGNIPDNFSQPVPFEFLKELDDNFWECLA